MQRNLERWLFVCTGNICRSPFAEVAARRLGAGSDLEFASAGTIARPANPATTGGIRAAADLGFDLNGHRATHLTPAVIAGADRVFGMEEEHIDAVLDLEPTARVELLDPDGRAVPDPYGGDHADYLASYRQIMAALRLRLG